MKIVKTILLMSVASVALTSAAVAGGKPSCGTYVRGHIGGSQGIQLAKDSLFAGQGASKNNNFGVYGGLGIEERTSLSHMHPNLMGGFGADINLESTRFKQNGRVLGVAGATLNSEVKRQVTVNALGQLGWHVKHNLLPYIVAGASYTQFKFSSTLKNGNAISSVSKTKNKLGWAGGLGLTWGITHKWSSDFRYLYTAYGTTKTDMRLSTALNTAKAPTAYHAVTVGVTYKI